MKQSEGFATGRVVVVIKSKVSRDVKGLIIVYDFALSLHKGSDVIRFGARRWVDITFSDPSRPTHLGTSAVCHLPPPPRHIAGLTDRGHLMELWVGCFRAQVRQLHLLGSAQFSLSNARADSRT
jgi:hypothetical protein